MEIGIGFSSEELGPQQIVRGAGLAEEAGFRDVWVSDHFHPWIDAQGQSPFVWSVLGGIATATSHLRVGTGVTCPIMRIHPAVIAQAAATAQCMFDGRFWLGVGSGEALNEHITGAKWPVIDVRLEMLEEAIEIIRGLWRGDTFDHHGRYFTVENARIYTLPDAAPPIYVSSFGPKALHVAARVGDGLITTAPQRDMLDDYDRLGGRGPKLGQMKVAYADSVEEGEQLAYKLWPTTGLSGQLSQELATPQYFEEAVATVRQEDVVNSTPCGPDPQVHLDALAKYRDAGFDHVYVTQIGSDLEAFIDFYAREIVPALMQPA